MSQLHLELRRTVERLLGEKKLSMLTGDNWRDGVPSVGGVYIIWKKKSRKPAYIGESSVLNHRFGDLERSVNHTFRAWLKKERQLSEEALSNHIRDNYLISFMPIKFGRKEVEEFLVLRWRHILKRNKPLKRFIEGSDWFKNWESAKVRGLK